MISSWDELYFGVLLFASQRLHNSKVKHVSSRIISSQVCLNTMGTKKSKTFTDVTTILTSLSHDETLANTPILYTKEPQRNVPPISNWLCVILNFNGQCSLMNFILRGMKLMSPEERRFCLGIPLWNHSSKQKNVIPSRKSFGDKTHCVFM